jgi:hypothetical protein
MLFLILDGTGSFLGLEAFSKLFEALLLLVLGERGDLLG